MLVGHTLGSGWCLSVCEAAREAGGSWRPAGGSIRVAPRDGPTANPERAAAEAARRARGKVRRYCAANPLEPSRHPDLRRLGVSRSSSAA